MIYVYSTLRGQKFYPSKLQKISTTIIRKSYDPGDIGTIGKYRDKPIPYGWCSITVPDQIENENKISWLADFLYKHMNYLKELGVEDLTFEILWSGVQGNMELSVEELTKIHRLNLPLSMTYSYEEEK